MGWDDSTWWWTAAGVLVAAELATGTFYLLMLALGMAVGALAAHAGLGAAQQFVIAALAGGGAVVAWRYGHRRAPPAEPAASNPDVNLDIGATVRVEHWNADGSARVRYRGTDWNVRFQGSGVPEPGTFTIRALDGSCLVVER